MSEKNCENCAHLSSFYQEGYTGYECEKGHEEYPANCEDWYCLEKYKNELNEWIDEQAKKEGWV